jgi:hypothetical protein
MARNAAIVIQAPQINQAILLVLDRNRTEQADQESQASGGDDLVIRLGTGTAARMGERPRLDRFDPGELDDYLAAVRHLPAEAEF